MSEKVLQKSLLPLVSVEIQSMEDCGSAGEFDHVCGNSPGGDSVKRQFGFFYVLKALTASFC